MSKKKISAISRVPDAWHSELCVEMLEQRVMYSADVLGTVEVEQFSDSALASDDQLLQNQPTIDNPLAVPTELVVIDSGIPDRGQIVADINQQIATGRNLQLLEIDIHTDGIAAITDTLVNKLQNPSGFNAIHIVSHGSDTGLAIGSQWLDQHSLANYTEQLSQWRQSLTDNADILLYGCELAASEEGRLLMASLSDATSAQLSASDDVTGHSSLGGDWDLEFETGSIETETILSEELQASWQHDLAELEIIKVKDDAFLQQKWNTDIELTNDQQPMTNILANDPTALGETVVTDFHIASITQQTDGSLGSIEETGTDTYTYKPQADALGEEILQYIVSDSPVTMAAHYPLDPAESTTIYDATGLTAPDPTSNFPEIVNDEFMFDGDDYIQIPDLDYTDDFSVSFDFHLGAQNLGVQTLFHHGTTATRDSDIISVKIDYYIAYRWSIYLSDNEETGDRVRRPGIQSAPGWHNMTITHDSGGVGFTVYVDGISMGIYDNEPRGGGTFNPDGPINIGRYLDPTDNQNPEQYLHTNSIRDIRIYNDVVDINDIVDENGDTIPVHYDDAEVTFTLVEEGPPVFIDLDSNSIVNLTEGSIARIDSNAEIYDIELSGADNFNGSSLTIERELNTSIDDEFHALMRNASTHGLQSLTENSPLVYLDEYDGAVEIGTVEINSNGQLKLLFNQNATQALVNNTIQAIGYKNTNVATTDTLVNLQWTFHDGPLDDPQTNQAVEIVPISLLTAGFSHHYTDSGLNLDEDSSLVDFNFDPTEFFTHNRADQSEDMRMELVVNKGILLIDAAVPGVEITGYNSNTLKLKGSVTQINAAINTLQYQPDSNIHGADELVIKAKVGSPSAITISETIAITINPVNDSPTGDTDPLATAGIQIQENAPAITLPGLVNIQDIELDDLTYAGSTLEIVRLNDNSVPATSPHDLYFVDPVISNAGFVDIQQTNSRLFLRFLAGTTSAEVNSVMSAISYQNTDNNPQGTITLQWTFNDSNTGSQGSGDMLSVSTQTTVSITPENDPPTTSAVTLASIVEDSGTRIIDQGDMLVNATDSENNVLTATGLAINSGQGSLVNNGNGTWSYTPAQNDDTGVDFNYFVTDGEHNTAGSASLDITPQNDEPVTANVTFTAISEDAGAQLITQAQLLSLATDVEGDSLTASNLTIIAGQGTLENNGNGSWTYTPALHDDSNVSFGYTVSDGINNVAGSATMDIVAQNDSPQVANVVLTPVIEDSGVRLITQTELLSNATDIENDLLSATNLVIRIGNGSLLNNGDGSWSYTPAPNDDTDISLSYYVSDGVTQVAASATLDIIPQNDAPQNSTAILTPVPEDYGIRPITQAQLLVNATDVDGDTLTATDLAISTGRGTLENNGDGSWVYTPDLNDDTDVSFTYTITDGADNIVATASMDITAQNDAPVTSHVVLAPISEDSGSRQITQSQLLATTTDVENDPLIASELAITEGAGTLADQGDGSWRYLPAIDDDTEVQFSYIATDGVNSIPVTATLEITPQNDLPLTSNVVLTPIPEDSGTRVITQSELLFNATDVDADTLTAINLTINTGNGTLLDNSDGSWSYTAQTNDDASVSLSYAITDGFETIAASATLDITPLNDAPLTSNVVLPPVTEDSAAVVITQAQLLSTATDVEADSLTATHLSVSAGNAILLNNADGSWNYTPAPDDDSNISFAYIITDGENHIAGTATLDITPQNDSPITSTVVLTPIMEDSGLRLITQDELLLNATDVDGDGLKAIDLTISTGNGALQNNGDGSWFYTPVADDDTAVGFSYTVTDSVNTATGSATLNLIAQNDLPATSNVTLGPILEDSGHLIITQSELLANASDPESDPLVASGFQISHGNGQLLNNHDGTWSYTPRPNDDTSVEFSYLIGDGYSVIPAVATLDILSVNDPPESHQVILLSIPEDSNGRLITQAELLSNASDIETDTLTAIDLNLTSEHGTLANNNDGTWVYIPAENDDLSASFSYRISDGTITVAATALLDITPVDDIPTTSHIILSPIDEDSGPHTLTREQLLANAIDVDGELLTAHSLSASGNGVLTENNSGSWEYTPAANDDTDVQFHYVISDNNNEVSGSASLDIIAIDDAPTAQNFTISTVENTAITIDSSIPGFNDVDGDLFAGLKITRLPLQGELRLHDEPAFVNTVISAEDLAAGALSFTPADNQSGSSYAQIQFRVISNNNEPALSENPYTLTIDVININDAPQVSDARFTVNAESAYTFNLNDFDYSDPLDNPQHELLSITITELPQAGALTLYGEPLEAGLVITRSELEYGALSYLATASEPLPPVTSFAFVVTDNAGTEYGGINTSQIPTVFTLALNRSPIAVADEFFAEQSSLATGSVLDNDSDPDEDQLTTHVDSAPANGTLTLNSDGSFVYIHNGSNTDTDVFTYSVSDGELSQTARVYINIASSTDSNPAVVHNATRLQPMTISTDVEIFGALDTATGFDVQLRGTSDHASPEWLYFDANSRSLSGTPPENGVFIVQLIATSNNAELAVVDLVINVNNEPQTASAQALPPFAGVAIDTAQLQNNKSGPHAAVVERTDSNAAQRSLLPSVTDQPAPTNSVTEGVVSVPELARAELPVVTVAMAHKTTQTRVMDVVQNNEINSDVPDHILPLEELFRFEDFNQTDSNLARQLNDTRDELATEATAKFEVVSSAATASAGFTLGYIVWLIRGGVLVTSMLSSLPAWRMIDPLPVLDTGAVEDDEGESLEEMVTSPEEPATSPKTMPQADEEQT